MYKSTTFTETFLEHWKNWFFAHLGPHELPILCRIQKICPPSFRTPEKVPYPILKKYFTKHISSSYKDPDTITHYLRTEYPELEAKLAGLPTPAAYDDLMELDIEIENCDLVLALLLSGRDDLQRWSEQIMREQPPFLIVEEQAAAPPPSNPLEKENKRLTRLLDDMKKTSLKKEQKLQRELAKLKKEAGNALQAVKQEKKIYKELEADFHKGLKHEQLLRKEAERKIAMLETTNQRLQEQIKRLEKQQTHLEDYNQKLQEKICGLNCEIDRLTAFTPATPEKSASAHAIDTPLAPEPAESAANARVHQAEAATDSSNRHAGADSNGSKSQHQAAENQSKYPETVRGILQIPIRSRFGFISTEQGMDLFVSEKIIYNIGAEDGDELEGVLIGKYAPGLPQYRYRVVQKGKEPTNHRELLGIVEDRSGWIGVRDLYEAEIFIPLHAYELSNVTAGDVVTILFDESHPHNNRILTVHEHLTTEEAERYRTTRRKKSSSKDADAGQEIEKTLTGVNVLICGAQSNMVAQYEQAIKLRGGQVVILENQPPSMEPYVAKADVIICNTHQMNHPFYWVLREESAKQNKPLRYPISGGVSSILREVETFVKRVS